ncbi:MAG: ABC transporter substrate-binding protein [Burkholderiales bacterium]|jgi:NitT/TauT family transport system substrate-binding protein|nr:ABC transporter substrate-binding protein [Burkholderiales bacterium]
MPFPIRLARFPLAAALALGFAGSALAQQKFTFLTNWYAQAEHGGYYHALASGAYKAAGLDVTIRMGGPQVNTLQMMAAGQADCIMGSSDTQVLKIREQGIPAVTIATIFQKDPQGLTANPDTRRIEELKGRTILISTGARNTYWPWLKATFGFTEDQARPYAFSLAPFVQDKSIALQGYVTFDPYAVKSQTGIDPSFFLFADLGWPPYANTVVCMEQTLKDKPQMVAAFLKASLEGWKNYLTGDRAAAHALIKKDNPQMNDGQLEFAVRTMMERGMVMGGDAAKAGIGTITPERLKKTYDFLVGAKLLDPKVDLAASYDTRFISAIKVMP